MLPFARTTFPLLALLLLPARAPAQQQPDRIASVVRVLRRVLHSEPKHAWSSLQSLRQELAIVPDPKTGSRVGTQVLAGLCGNIEPCWLEPAETAALVRDLMAAYGLAPAADHALEAAGARARIDSYDARARLGVTLRPLERPWPGQPAPASRPSAAELDAGELAALRAAGIGLHVARLDSYLHADADDPTPLFAYLLGVLEFLDERTEGSDVGAGDLLKGAPRRIKLKALDPKRIEGATDFGSDEQSFFWHSRARSRLVLEPEAAPAARAPRAARLTLVLAGFSSSPIDAEGAKVRAEFELVQPGAAGELRVRSGRPFFVLGPELDPARPFRIEAVVPPGNVMVSREVLVRSAPAR